MSFIVIEDAKQVKSAFKKLEKKLISQSNSHGKINVGWFGGNRDITAYWFAKHKFWWGSKTSTWGYWNPFGITPDENEPEWNHGHYSITCQCNPPISGNSWTKASAFVKDQDGQIYLCHSGKIGGGRKGIGKSAFEENFSGIKQWQIVQGSSGPKKVVIISHLEDKNLVRNLAFFVREVKKIKDLAVQEKLHKTPKFLSKIFNPEFEGNRTPYTQSQTIHANVSHGSIVNNLEKIAQKYGFETFSNRATDLYLENESGTTAMLEIKTDLSTESKYKAIGQLIYNSVLQDTSNPILIAVFPHPIDNNFKKVLNNLDIRFVSYRWKNEKLIFEKNLDLVLNSLKRTKLPKKSSNHPE